MIANDHDSRSAGQIFADDEALRAEDQRYSDRMARVIDYTPIEERGSPCLTTCKWFGEHGCMIYGGKIADLMKCEDYRKWVEARK